MDFSSTSTFWTDFVKNHISNSPVSIKCFQDLIIDFDPVPAETVFACAIDLGAMECVAGGANAPLTKFNKCSGNAFNLSGN